MCGSLRTLSYVPRGGDCPTRWDFVGGLRGEMLVRLEIANDKVVAVEPLLLDVAQRIRDVRVGDELTLREPGQPARTVEVLGISDLRGPAPIAQQLYAELSAKSPEALRSVAHRGAVNADPERTSA